MCFVGRCRKSQLKPARGIRHKTSGPGYNASTTKQQNHSASHGTPIYHKECNIYPPTPPARQDLANNIITVLHNMYSYQYVRQKTLHHTRPRIPFQRSSAKQKRQNNKTRPKHADDKTLPHGKSQHSNNPHRYSHGAVLPRCHQGAIEARLQPSPTIPAAPAPELPTRFISHQIEFTVGSKRQAATPPPSPRGTHERTHRHKYAASSPTPIVTVRRKHLRKAAHQMDGRRKQWGPKIARYKSGKLYIAGQGARTPTLSRGEGQTETPWYLSAAQMFQTQT